jgi:hypothetical protein
MSIFVGIAVGAIPVAKWSAGRYAAGHDRQVSVLIELGPVSLNLVDPGVADQIE